MSEEDSYNASDRAEMKSKLPYFDYLLAAFEKGFEPLETCFGHHVHWGYWEFPEHAKHTQEDFSAAAENLSQLIYTSAHVRNGQAILDVGCGFGGTVSSLNNQYQNMELTGLNIDERQISRARRRIAATGTNKVEFQQGDACALPFADNSFDVVLAVECIFHFPSREQFFKEVQRVLKPGGYLALSDFLLSRKLSEYHNINVFQFLINGFFGSCNVQYTREKYHELAQSTNFRVDVDRDITKNTLPTYTVLKLLMNTYELYKLYKLKIIALNFTIWCIELLSKKNLLKYHIFSFISHKNRDEQQLQSVGQAESGNETDKPPC